MTAGDQAVENASRKLREVSQQWAAEGGVKAKLAEPLAEDAEFLRKLKPSLIKARAKGERPTPEPETEERRPAPPGPQLGKRPDAKKRKGGGPNPWVVLAAALTAGIVIAKVIDWRSHAHPRD